MSHVAIFGGRPMLKRGPFKLQSLRILIDRNVPIGTILDVGVSRGTPELIECFPNTPHILFEPVAEHYATVRQVYAKLDYRLVEAAVSDSDGDQTLMVQRIGGTEVNYSSVIDAPFNGAETRTIRGIRLDTFIKDNRIRKPYFLKVDVDGNELKVLSGAIETLKDTSVVMIETPKGQFSERTAFLERQGFELHDLVAPCYYDDSFWQCDAIYIRQVIHARCFKQLLHADFQPSAYVEFNETSVGSA
jgi:FkbM family methyltransferase